MTSSNDLLRAFSQIELHRWGTAGRLLAYLGSRPDLNGVVIGSLRDAAAALRLSVRTVRAALDRLEADGVLVAEDRGGSSGFAYRIQEPTSWGEGVPWHGDRRDAAMTLHALARLQARAQESLSARDWDRAQRLILRGLRTAHLETVVRGARAAHKSDFPARGQGRAKTAALSLSREAAAGPRLRRADLEGGRELSLSISEGQRALLAAFFDGVGHDRELWGAPLQQLLELGRDAGEHLGTLCELAADPAGPSLFKQRVAQLAKARKEAAGFMPSPAVDPGLERQLQRRRLAFDLEGVMVALETAPGDRALVEEKLRIEEEIGRLDDEAQVREHLAGILEA